VQSGAASDPDGELDDLLRDVRIETSWEGSSAAVSVRGEVDVATAPLFAAVLDGVCGQRPARVDVDLTSVDFVDSAGLLALIAARRRVTGDGGELAVRCAPGFLRRVFASTGLDRVFDMGEFDRGEVLPVSRW